MSIDLGPFSGKGWDAEKPWRQGAMLVPATPISKERAKEIIEAAQARAHCTPWSDQLVRVMTQGEYHHVRNVWDTLPGHTCFVDALCKLAR
jgi:hypothetical protein